MRSGPTQIHQFSVESHAIRCLPNIVPICNHPMIALHGKAYDNTCIFCHEISEEITTANMLIEKPPVDDTFCGNQACHGTVWTYAGFEADALQPILEEQLFHLLNTSPYLMFEDQTYSNTFSAIFEGRFIACHNSSDLIAGLDLGSYPSMLVGGENGTGIVPGDLSRSLIYIRQTEASGYFSQLLEDEIEAVEAWILAGAGE